eukprot:2134189-Amphidinium_carterae.1
MTKTTLGHCTPVRKDTHFSLAASGCQRTCSTEGGSAKGRSRAYPLNVSMKLRDFSGSRWRPARLSVQACGAGPSGLAGQHNPEHRVRFRH